MRPEAYAFATVALSFLALFVAAFKGPINRFFKAHHAERSTETDTRSASKRFPA
jgi:hypothetical protein